jgi:predicted dithiol-disulfide oxidoreductase (DUF899 family)
MSEHKRQPIVDHTAWTAARRELLRKEKDLVRSRDALAKARRELPWERVEKEYLFESASGPKTLADLFEEKSQLAVYHFMFAPDWEAGCKGCSFWADSFDRIAIHLAHRDVAFTAVSRAPLAKLAGYQKRMGWSFPWVSSAGSDFNFDYGVSFDTSRKEHEYNYATQPIKSPELPGLSVFCRMNGRVEGREGEPIFHTYSAYARGIDAMNVAYQILDLVPKGRDEDHFAHPFEWLRRHDEYDARG